MISNEFYQEVIHSSICPMDFSNIWNRFTEFQKDAITILKDFHRICELYHIHYQLAFGSLLGAIRDNGMIPWDYDVDVFVPYSEKNKLIEALNKELLNQYIIDCPENDRNCVHYFMRLLPKDYSTDMLHLDVFYLIGLPENEEKRKEKEAHLHRYLLCRHMKKIRIDKVKTHWKRIMKTLFFKTVYAFIPMKMMDKRMDKLCSEISFENSKVCTPGLNSYRHIVFDSEKIRQTKLIPLPAGSFYIPIYYDEVLTQLYSDYHRIYPLENRLTEMLNHYNKLTNSSVAIGIHANNGRYYSSKAQ